jgi:hypothetical protein
MPHSHCCELPYRRKHPACCSSTAFTYSSNLAGSYPPTVSSNSFDCSLQLHMIMATNCISKLTCCKSWSASLSSLNHCLQLNLPIRSITASKCISTLAQSWPRCVSLSSPDGDFQVHLKLLSSTACIQSRYTVCRWLAISRHIPMRIQTDLMSYKNR